MTAVSGITREGYDTYFELSFPPTAGLLSTIRRCVSDLYTQVLGDPDLASLLSMAAHELLENAVLHSLDGHPSMSIGVRLRHGGFDLAVDTQNRASASQAAALQSRIEEISAAPDPAAHYLELMRRTVKRTDGSGLGLGRVRAEADMSLSARVATDTVFVFARATYALRPTAAAR